MSTQVEICNLALNHIGVRNITSMAELSEAARRCTLVYEPAVEAVLREHSWNFATKVVALALISGETVPGWDYLYTYPANCLNPIKVYDEENARTTTPFEFRVLQAPTGNVKAIATNVEDAYCEYVAKITDETMFDTSFVEALAYKLAGQLAQPLTKNTQLGVNMLNIYNQTINKAKATNKNEGNVKNEQVSAYIDARG